jgi:hypothetical protein
MKKPNDWVSDAQFESKPITLDHINARSVILVTALLWRRQWSEYSQRNPTIHYEFHEYEPTDHFDRLSRYFAKGFSNFMDNFRFFVTRKDTFKQLDINRRHRQFSSLKVGLGLILE